MSTLIKSLRDKLAAKSLQRNTSDSRHWLYSNVRRLVPSPRYNQLRSEERLVSKPLPGHMYMYLYDPKTKEQMDYYDRFPLVFVVKYLPDGFLGLNLHYLQPVYRMKLFESLLQYASNDQYDERTRLRLTWRKLTAFRRSDFAKVCVKRYLYSQLDSKFIHVPAQDWELVVFLPFEKFKQKNRSFDKRDVWVETASMVR